MELRVVPLSHEHLDRLPLPEVADPRAYFTPGSIGCCLLADGEPVFAGGIVNLQWNRGEAWMLPTPFFREHAKTCLREMRAKLPEMASDAGFIRVQGICFEGVPESLFRFLGFTFEGTMLRFGPSGETCWMYARVFDVEVV